MRHIFVHILNDFTFVHVFLCNYPCISLFIIFKLICICYFTMCSTLEHTDLRIARCVKSLYK